MKACVYHTKQFSSSVMTNMVFKAKSDRPDLFQKNNASVSVEALKNRIQPIPAKNAFECLATKVFAYSPSGKCIQLETKTEDAVVEFEN